MHGRVLDRKYFLRDRQLARFLNTFRYVIVYFAPTRRQPIIINMTFCELVKRAIILIFTQLEFLKHISKLKYCGEGFEKSNRFKKYVFVEVSRPTIGMQKNRE